MDEQQTVLCLPIVHSGRNVARRTLLALGVLAATVAGCSTLQGLSTPPLPTGWKTVDYHGVGVDVPSNWTVAPWRPNCGVNTPTVFIRPEQTSYLFCPAFMAGGAEVVLGSLPSSEAAPHAQSERINGLTAQVVSETVDDQCGHSPVTVSEAWVTLPAKGFTISISVGESPVCPGGGPGIATQIRGSIHRILPP